MAGIYVHIPFCKQACNYCNFHFSTNKQLIPEMVDAICKEALLRKNYLSEKVETLYLGGGTPSLLNEEELHKILTTIHSLFSLGEDMEITLETNPDDISAESLLRWKSLGINRLSIGIQSFEEKELLWMNRAHNAIEAYQCIGLAKEAGFNNMSIDLIYGTASLTDEIWEKTLELAFQSGVPHLSCYALTVEPKTALHHHIMKGRQADMDPEKQSRHFSILTKAASSAGFEQYELSNFAKPGFRSRHNSNYWKEAAYLGIGPSAHSFNKTSRQWNIANNALYIESLKKDEIPFEIETLSIQDQWNEYIMTSLRTVEGISLQKIATDWGEESLSTLLLASKKHIEGGHMQQDNGALILTMDGKFLADGIAADLFRTE